MEIKHDTEPDLSLRRTVEGDDKISDTGEEASVEDLIQELENSKKLTAEYLDLLQRKQAEFENYKKRVDREKEDLIKYANANLILELIDVMENLEKGLESAKKADNIDPVVQGMELVYRELKTILEARGLKPIESLGKKFDPYCNEAMLTTQTDEYPNNTVLEEFQRGYRVNDRIIRYSKVRVSKKPENSK